MGIRVALNHRTEYRYAKAVSLGPHVVRLRPAPHCRTPIESYSLRVKPDEHYINWQQDPFGNYQARLVFPEKTTRLVIEVDLIADLTVINPFDFFVEEYAENFPFVYTDVNRIELAAYLQVKDNGPLLNAWLAENTPAAGTINDWLVAINRAVQRDVAYRVRLEPGVQSCEETLLSASGSCRDSGWLLVQIMRHCGLAARFVSGYLVQLTADEKSLSGASGPAADFTDLHAWAEVYVPGAGWIGLDPTSGLFAGEGHVPLACTPMPISAAPITGLADTTAEEFLFSNTVTRVDEHVRVTKPYTQNDWQAVLSLGQQVDQQLLAQDVRLTMGGEPTFVSMDDMQGDEWNFTALSDDKLRLSSELMHRMREHYAPQGVPTFAQGKWYPGEPTPRWALTCYWRKDGQPLWQDMSRLALPGKPGQASRSDAQRFALCLAGWLGVHNSCVHELYEDPLYHLQLESLLPVAVVLDDYDLKDSQVRRQLAIRLSQGLDEAVGWALPLRYISDDSAESRWISCRWPMRRNMVFLAPGDSPAGLRLPLDSLETDPDDDVLAYAEDNFDPQTALPVFSPIAENQADSAHRDSGKPPQTDPHTSVFRTALCVEWRDQGIHVFMPPQRSAEEFVALLDAIERAASESAVAVSIEGYEPPRDARLNSFRITPDPGVIEVNVHPVSNFEELVQQTESLYAMAKEVRLSAEKFLVDGRHTGTGGGNHITFGGPTPADSPFLRRPDLLGSLITFWQHHPSLSYLFSGLFIGPTSQAPRIDEARSESLYELELALSRLPDGGSEQPWLVDRLLRHLLIDVTGNTHRTEICIDKLYSPDGPAGRQGLVEFRAFEMPPHARMSIVQALLLRCLISRFWQTPYRGKLIRWGTELHDRFMLPHYLWQDISDVIDDVCSHNMAFDVHWLDAFWEFRFPIYGTRQIGDISLELRAAIEPWHVLGEEASAGGMSRYVDSSMERLQLKVTGLNDERYRITCNGRALPLRSTGTRGEYVVGVRYRAWQPPSCLHPDLPVDVPLVFDVIDTWSQRSLGGCAYHAAHPGGRHYEDVPVNANVAEARRLARFDPNFHTPSPATPIAQAQPATGYFNPTEALTSVSAFTSMPENAEYPHTADLRMAK
jgi:uncharacterized protein (DUF2126 family)/transglutaminase-like putative cysteine protease